MRITILGLPGSGKSTLARKISQKKNIPHIKAESWVSDGVYSLIQPEISRRAEHVIFLNIPLRQRLFNHATRTLNRRKRKGEMTLLGDLMFFFEMIGRDSDKPWKISDLLKDHQSKTVVLKSRKEIDDYLKKL